MFIRGGKITIKSLKAFIEATYTDVKVYKDYIRDDTLSTEYTKIYYNPTSKILIASERPTHTKRDVLSDVLAGLDLTGKLFKKVDTRFKTAYKTLNNALKKYSDRKNSILIGYSLGAIVAEQFSRDNPEAYDEVFLVSKPVLPSDILKGNKPLSNVTEVRSELDVTSALKPLQESAEREVVIKAETKNPVTEHKISEVLPRLDQEQEIGDENILSGVGMGQELRKMNYFDLTYLQRQQLANQTYIDMAMRNVVEQQRSLERIRQEMGEEGVEVSDDVSAYLSTINKRLIGATTDIDKLFDFTSVTNVSQDDKNRALKFGYDPNEIDDKFISLRFASYNQAIDFSSKVVLNLELILDNLRSIAKIIRDVSPENFDFSQLDNIFKIYKKFKNIYGKFVDRFELVDETDNVIARGIKDREKMTGRIDQEGVTFSAYLGQIDKLCIEIINFFDTFKEISKEKGTEKISGSGFLRDEDMPKRYL